MEHNVIKVPADIIITTIYQIDIRVWQCGINSLKRIAEGVWVFDRG